MLKERIKKKETDKPPPKTDIPSPQMDIPSKWIFPPSNYRTTPVIKLQHIHTDQLFYSYSSDRVYGIRLIIHHSSSISHVVLSKISILTNPYPPPESREVNKK